MTEMQRVRSFAAERRIHSDRHETVVGCVNNQPASETGVAGTAVTRSTGRGWPALTVGQLL